MDKFIIIDPCYVMDEKQYKGICDFAECRFSKVGTMLKSRHKTGGDPITFHVIRDTPHGDGETNYFGQDVGVDAGMLSIAERARGWDGAKEYGATFATLEEAKAAFPRILRRF